MASAKRRRSHNNDNLHHLVPNELGIDRSLSIVGHDLGSMVAFAYALRYRNDAVSLTTMEAPLPGTDYCEERKVAKSAWHFDFHANPDIAVYLTHGRSTATPAPSKRQARCARSAMSTANSRHNADIQGSNRAPFR